MISFYSGPDSTEEQRGPKREESGQQPSIGPDHRHDPPRNGVLNSVSWQKIRKTAAGKSRANRARRKAMLGQAFENRDRLPDASDLDVCCCCRSLCFSPEAFDRRVQTSSFARENRRNANTNHHQAESTPRFFLSPLGAPLMAPADEPGAIFSDWQFAGGQAWFVCDLRIPEGNQCSSQAGHRLL